MHGPDDFDLTKFLEKDLLFFCMMETVRIGTDEINGIKHQLPVNPLLHPAIEEPGISAKPLDHRMLIHQSFHWWRVLDLTGYRFGLSFDPGPRPQPGINNPADSKHQARSSS